MIATHTVIRPWLTALAVLIFATLLQAAPVIQIQPVSKTVNQTDSVTFNVTATGTGTLSYQWQKDGVDIPGATSSNFSLSSAEPWHIGDYTVKATDSTGAVTSQLATLRLNNIENDIWRGLIAYNKFDNGLGDTAGLQQNLSIQNGRFSTARFGGDSKCIELTGESSYIWAPNVLPNNINNFTWSLWFKAYSLPTGAFPGNPSLIGFALIESPLSLGGNSNSPYVILKPNKSVFFTSVDSISGTIVGESEEGVWDVNEWTHIAAVGNFDEDNVNIYINGALINTMNVQSYGEKYKNLLFGADRRLLQTPQNDVYFEGSIDDIKIFNRALNDAEVQALYASEATVQFTVQPQSQTVNQGQAVTLSVTAGGISSLSYQWQKDGVDIPGATSAALTISSFKPWHGGSYRVQVTDSVNTVWSNSAQLGLNAAQPASLWQDLLLFLPFAGSNSDLSPSARTITQSNVGFGESPAGTPVGSATFNGSSSRMDFAPNLPNLTGMTYSTWFRTTKTTGSQSLFADWDDAASNDVSVAIVGDRLFVQSTKNGSNLSWTSDPIVQAGQWMHLTFVMGATQSLILVNGELYATLNATASNVGYKLRSNIGYFNYGAGEYFYSGNLAALRIYGRALTLQEAQNLYTADAPTRTQTLTFAPIADQLTTDAVALTATGGDSGNPVTFAVTAGPGLITDGVLTFTGAGQVTVTASQAGNDNYLAAEEVSRTFTVSKAPASMQWENLFHIDDGTPRPVAFSSTPANLPFVLLYEGQATAPTQTGRYAVIANLDHPMYSGSGNTTLTILGLSGRGQSLPSGSSQPQEVNGTDFGRVLPGRVATQTFSITNPGTVPVALTGRPLVEILGDHAGDFQVSVPPAAEIPAGGSVSFEVRFAPTQPGARRAVVSLACEALANGPITFAVGGFGALPSLLAQTITFNLPTTLFQSQGPVPLIATASSGLPVSWRILSGPAELQQGQLLLSEPGVVKIQASQEGGGNFAAAKPVVRTLTVKADPTGLTLADLNQTYNGTPRPITVLGTDEEVTVTYFINKLPSDTPPTDAGSYPVTAVAGPVTKKGTLIIARAPLIVQVQDQRKLVGQQNPKLTAQVTGFIGEDNQNTVLFRPIAVTTKAKADSPPGLYPITSSGGAAVNYTFIHRPGTLVVEGYVGNFEALLRDPDSDLPMGLLKLTVPSTSQSLSANLVLVDQAKPLGLAGTLNLDPETRVARSQLSRVINKTDTYQVDLTLSLFGELAVEVRKNNQLVAEAEDGTRLRDVVKGEAVPQMAAYTAVLEPAEDDAAPSAPGWATVKVEAAGTLALTGKLGDGTPFTASLPMDVSEGYRFFVQPYKRAGAYLGGAWSLTAHPEVVDTWQARGVELIWLKGDNAKDSGYRSGFGPLTVALEMDRWMAVTKTSTLAQLLGIAELTVSHDSTGSASEVLLANRVAVDPTGMLRVLAPVTNPPNLRKWTAKVNPSTGAYSGSFELIDDLTQKRKVSFSGVFRQAADAEADGLQGRGHYLLPPLKGAPSTETTTGRMEFQRE